jgi:hypothetical protein
MVRFYASLGILIQMWHLMKANHQQLYMDMHAHCHGLDLIGVKN